MDANQIFSAIADELKGQLGAGYKTISDLVDRQAANFAKRIENYANARIDGYLKDDDELFVKRLKRLGAEAASLARNIAMLTALTIEKTWNAIVGILWGALRTILSGAGIPAGLLPETPPVKI